MRELPLGFNLETALEQVDDPVERAQLINEAYLFLGVQLVHGADSPAPYRSPEP